MGNLIKVDICGNGSVIFKTEKDSEVFINLWKKAGQAIGYITKENLYETAINFAKTVCINSNLLSFKNKITNEQNERP